MLGGNPCLQPGQLGPALVGVSGHSDNICSILWVYVRSGSGSIIHAGGRSGCGHSVGTSCEAD